MLLFIIFVLVCDIDIQPTTKKGKVILKIRDKRRNYRGLHGCLLLSLRAYTVQVQFNSRSFFQKYIKKGVPSKNARSTHIHKTT